MPHGAAGHPGTVRLPADRGLQPGLRREAVACATARASGRHRADRACDGAGHDAGGTAPPGGADLGQRAFPVDGVEHGARRDVSARARRRTRCLCRGERGAEQRGPRGAAGDRAARRICRPLAGPAAPRAPIIAPMNRWALVLLASITGSVFAQPNGIVLVAKPGMADPNFSETVVLVTWTEEGTTVGLVLNRPSAQRLV